MPLCKQWKQCKNFSGCASSISDDISSLIGIIPSDQPNNFWKWTQTFSDFYYSILFNCIVSGFSSIPSTLYNDPRRCWESFQNWANTSNIPTWSKMQDHLRSTFSRKIPTIRNFRYFQFFEKLWDTFIPRIRQFCKKYTKGKIHDSDHFCTFPGKSL